MRHVLKLGLSCQVTFRVEHVMAQALRAYQENGDLEQDALTDFDAEGASIARSLDMLCEDLDVFCENHMDLASEAALQRKQQMQRRLAFVQTWWNDPERFEQVVTSGRYLKLCNLTEWITDFDERAWERVKSEVIAERDRLLAGD
jgi:hypothetical protein